MKSKRVLIIIPHLGVGGTEVQTFNIAYALRSAGYTVRVLCLYRHIKEVENKFLGIDVKIDILSPEYSNYNVKIKYPKRFGLVKFLYNGLKDTLNDFGPDVIHVQYMTPGATVILMLKYIFRQKNIIATSHTAADIYSKNGLRLVRFISRNCLRAFQCITLAAEKGYFGSANLFNGKLEAGGGNHFTIYNSLPQEISLTDKRKSFDNRNLTIGVVSRLEAIKGMDLVIPAFAKAFAECKRLKLLIVGDGSLKNDMEKQVIEYGLSEAVMFVGRKKQSELKEWYDKIDILLMPSRSEGFGLTALEGMARGCVPVVAKVGGLPEVVTDGCGYLHCPEDVEDMANCILDGIESLEKKSDAAIQRVSKFSADNYNESIKSLYKAI